MDDDLKKDKTDAKAAKAAKKAERETAEQRVAKELRDRRIGQLEAARSAAMDLVHELGRIRKTTADLEALSSHLSAFYQEIDKFAKGKNMVGVTDLVVELANSGIRDAKALIKGDTYLDRTKEFVPAGDNPVYPDVVLVVRAVRESIERKQKQCQNSGNGVRQTLSEANTIAAALELYLENGRVRQSKDTVKERVRGEVASNWFTGDYGSGYYFDFDDLDNYSLDTYLSRGLTMDPEDTVDESEEDEANESAEEPEEDEI
jgi:hypothetical protein